MGDKPSRIMGYKGSLVMGYNLSHIMGYSGFFVMEDNLSHIVGYKGSLFWKVGNFRKFEFLNLANFLWDFL